MNDTEAPVRDNETADMKAYREALATARAELADVERKLTELEPLAQRREMLHRSINLLSALAGEDDTAQGDAMLIRLPIREAAMLLLQRTGRPMKPLEIKATLEASGRHFTGNGIETVRSVLHKAMEFESVGQGFYALSEWSADKKKIASS